MNEKAKAVVTIALTKHLPNTIDYALEGYKNEAYQLKITPHRPTSFTRPMDNVVFPQ